jgi:hypothetical protein
MDSGSGGGVRVQSPSREKSVKIHPMHGHGSAAVCGVPRTVTRCGVEANC